MFIEGRFNHEDPDFPFGQAKHGEAVELPETFEATPANLDSLKVAYDALVHADAELNELHSGLDSLHLHRKLAAVQYSIRAAILKIERGEG